MLNPDFAAFLGSQPEIRDLSLQVTLSCMSGPFMLPPSVLLHLETFWSVHIDLDTLREVCTYISECVSLFSVGLEFMV